MSFEYKNTVTSEDLVSDAVTAFAEARTVFRARINALKADNADVESKDVQAALALLSKTLNTAVDQTMRAENERTKANGGLHDGAFDLDGARAEIGGRLARLRAAANAGGVS